MKTFLKERGIAYCFALLLCLCALVVFRHLTGFALPVFGMVLALVGWTFVLMLLEQREWTFFPLVVLLVGLWILLRTSRFQIYFETPAFTALVALVLMSVLWILSLVLRWFGPRLVVSLLVIVGWMLAAFGLYTLPRSGIALALPLPIATLLEVLHRKSPERGRNAWPMFGVAALFSLLLCIVPVSQKPYPYTWIRKAWDGVEALWEQLETRMYYRSDKGTAFSMDFNGASQSATTKSEDKPAQSLKVWLDYGDACVLYLPGTTLDHFDGAAWSDQLDDASSDDVFDWQYDTAEHIYALWRRDHAAGILSEDVFRQRRTDLTYREMETRTLFTTPGLLRIQVDEDRWPYHAYAGNVQFDYQQKKDCYYIMYFLEENSAQVEQLIRDVEGYTYDAEKPQSWGQISGDYSEQFLLRMVQTVQIEEALAARADVIRDKYLQLPEDLAPAVSDLASEITAGCTSDYDMVRAVESYLHENYAYAEHPARPARGEDLLEHLFDTKEGYCTWFATAACMMLRTQGIPTRFVQGYRTGLHGQTRVFLNEDDQHAWCEAYIQGYGWITVEASPGFASSRAAWEVQEKEQEEEEALAEEEVEEAVEQESTESGNSWLPVILAGLVILAGILLVLLRVRLRRRHYEQLSYTERSMEDLKQIQRLLAKRFYVRYPYETLRVFFQKVPWQDLGIEAPVVRDALRAFEDAAFSTSELDEVGWHAGRRLRLELERISRKKWWKRG